MFDRLSLPAMPDLGDAARLVRDGLSAGARNASGLLGSGAQAASGLCASVSSGIASRAADAFQRVERPSLDLSWLKDLSLPSLPQWPFGSLSEVSSPAVLLGVACEAAASTPFVAAATPEGWESTVGKSGLTWGHFFSNTGHDWSDEIDLDGLSRFLRERHPDKTALNVAAKTRQPPDTVKKWLLKLAVPNGRAIVVLVCVYGPEALAALLRNPPGWVVETARAAEQARLDEQLERLLEKRRGLAA